MSISIQISICKEQYMDTNADYIKQYKSVFPIGITDSLHELIAQLGIGSLHTRICPDLLTPLRIHYSI